MTSAEIRQSFLDFFRAKDHRIVPSAPVIPYDDPTLFFTNAGMNQFKDVFLGTGRRDYRRAADSQKCIRVTGKHNDLEEVGRDTYHHTFFEMLGNWSFGDYYKKEAIAWAWELLTGVWKLDKNRLYATVYESDDEAAALWPTVTDIDPSHVLRFGKKDNFWEMGETGPCGPCSEIHIDLTADGSGGPLVNAGDPRVMEIWNLVFIQYNRDEKGELSPLPAKHVDTGMGFERVCAVMQGKKSNYDSDVFLPIIRHIEQITSQRYASAGPDSQAPVSVAMRVIADHVRMLSFSIADGGIPSNEGRGYVMRRILRRAARFSRSLGMHDPFLFRVVEAVADSMGEQYPEIREKRAHIERVIRGEEESFNATLDRGLEIFSAAAERLGSSTVFPGDEAFRLYDTYGFPLDLTELMASERGLTVDADGFDRLMEEQRERSRQTQQITGKAAIVEQAFDGDVRSDFVGYDRFETMASVVDTRGTLAVLDETPFYAESGGQVSDTGILRIGTRTVRVVDVRKFHHANVLVLDQDPGHLKGASVKAEVDLPRRMSIMRNHSATHLVHEALRRVLGTHLHQQGSLVAPDRLRFDFNHFEKIPSGKLREIEDIVNEKIADAITVNAINDPREWLTIEQARQRYPNVKMFFGDKYGDRVRIVEMDPAFSVELCGGTHVTNTREIGLFKIISEGSIASGIRRIEAVTGDGLRDYIAGRIAATAGMDARIERLIREAEDLVRQLGPDRGTRPAAAVPAPLTIPAGPVTREVLANVEESIAGRESLIEELTKRMMDASKELSRARVSEAASGIDGIVAAAAKSEGITIAVSRVDVGSMDELKNLGDALRSKLSSGVGVLGSVIDEKVALVCVVSDDLIRDRKLQAGKIVGELARLLGGGGGGRPHLATAGGKDVGKLDEALGQTGSIVSRLAGSR